MAERIVEKKKGDLFLIIVRPAIISASYREPCKGWTDTISASGSIYLFSMLGLLRELPCDENTIIDELPVDTCVNFILAAGAYSYFKRTLSL